MARRSRVPAAAGTGSNTQGEKAERKIPDTEKEAKHVSIALNHPEPAWKPPPTFALRNSAAG